MNGKIEKPTIVQNIQSNPLGWMAQVAAILVLILNLWLASKLAPLAERISLNEIKVSALEKNDDKIEGWLTRVEGKLDQALSKSQVNSSRQSSVSQNTQSTPLPAPIITLQPPQTSVVVQNEPQSTPSPKDNQSDENRVIPSPISKLVERVLAL